MSDENWYAERPEQEQEWRGVLRRLEHHGIGPNTRTFKYALVTSDREIDVYADAQTDAILAKLVGLRIVAKGKVVDLSDEGYGTELWLASVNEAPEDPGGG